MNGAFAGAGFAAGMALDMEHHDRMRADAERRAYQETLIRLATVILAGPSGGAHTPESAVRAVHEIHQAAKAYTP